MRDVWQVNRYNGWNNRSAAAAATHCLAGDPVRVVSLGAAAITHAHRHLKVEPWVLASGMQKAGASQARALIACCLRKEGVNQREIAEVLGIAQSSVSDLIKKYLLEPKVQRALAAWIDEMRGIQ